MFNRYILINEIINDIEINFFTSFLGKIEVNKRNDITIIYASYEDEEAINDALEAFIADSMSNMKIYRDMICSKYLGTISFNIKLVSTVGPGE